MGKQLNSLSNTYIFKMYDETIGLQKKMVELSRTSTVLGDDNLIEHLSAIERRYNFPLKNKIMEDYRSNRIVLLYNERDVRLPTNIPCFLLNNGTNIICCVNVSNIATKNKQGEYSLDTKHLFSYMQGGTILTSCYQKYNSLISKANVVKLGSDIYSKLFTKVINKMFTLNVTPAKLDVISFLSSWFFIHRVLGRDSESMEEMNKKYALENCKSGSKLVIESYIDRFDPETDFVDFNTFIESLAKNVPGLEDITIRNFINQYVMNYGPTMLLALEFLPTLLFNLGAVSVGAFLNNQHVLEKMVGKEGEQLLKELVNL